MAIPMQIRLLVIVALSFVFLFQDHVKVSVDRNSNTTATSAFKFKSVSPPSKDDAATNAKMMLLDGDVDPNGGALSALTDGLVPTTEDQPAANVFFTAGTGGGRFRIDLGKALEIAQINTYSWHPGSRGPQVYRLRQRNIYQSGNRIVGYRRGSVFIHGELPGRSSLCPG